MSPYAVVVAPETPDERVVDRGYPTRFAAFQAIDAVRAELGAAYDYDVIEDLTA